MKSTLRTVTLALSIQALLPAVLHAQQQHPISWSLATNARAPQQGKQLLVALKAQIPFGWHLYSTSQPPGGPIATVITVVGDTSFSLAGTPRSRDPDLAPDNNFQIVTETYIDSVTFTLPIMPRLPGKQTLRVKVSYQTCTDRYCLPPAVDYLDLPLNVDPVKSPGATKPVQEPASVQAVNPAYPDGYDKSELAHPVKWSIASSSASVRQGVLIRVSPTARIPYGWHLYSATQPPGGPNRTTFTSADSSFILAGAPSSRAPDRAFDNNFSIETETFADSVTFAIPIMPRTAGRHTLQLDVRYQVCTEKFCNPPRVDRMELAFDVAAGDSTAAAAIAAVSGKPPTAVEPSPGSLPGGTTTQSLLTFLLLAAAMGALSLLTPCVFPMIPITVSYFTRTNETARGKPARNALVYAAGIIATFTVLGMAIAVLVGAGGINRFAANPWINLLVTAIFVAFALNLFGVYQIGVPAGALTKLDGAARKAGGSETAGILLMGLTFTLTSFTCTTPFVGTVLVMAARGSWIWPLAGLLVFSSVFALPFFVLALMPSAVAKLPRSGSWLQSVKVVMGFVELATAMKFLSNADLVLRWGVFTRSVVLAVWLVLSLLTVLYLLGVVGQPRDIPRTRPGAGRIALAALTLAIGVYLGSGLSGRRVGELESFLPPPEGGITAGETAVKGELPWMVNAFEAGIARGRAEKKQVLVDFTGYTCTNCRWMEANMFPRPEVTTELARFVRVRLYTDGQGEVYKRQQQLEQDKLGTVALPFYAIVDSMGDVKAKFLGMTRNTDKFVQFLKDGRSSADP